MAFLRDCDGFRSLITGSHGNWYVDSREYWTLMGWYAVDWQGVPIEVVVSPDVATFYDVVCIGPDQATLVAFAEAFDAHSQERTRCLRYSQGWSHSKAIERELGSVTWDDIVLPDDTLQRLRATVDGFALAKDAYRRFGFAWRRGVLLVGPPGTGKTMVCKAAASALPDFAFLYVSDMNERRNKEATIEIFKKARSCAPCILAFEDLDGMVRSNNRSVFLNEMDGFSKNDGVLIIASSNYPEKIDEALLRRPSRFDQVFHLGLPEMRERARFCRKALSKELLAERFASDFDVAALADRVAAATSGFTPAYLKEVLVAAALHRAQEGDLLLDDRYGDETLRQVGELRAHLKRTKDPLKLADMQAADYAMGFRD